MRDEVPSKRYHRYEMLTLLTLIPLAAVKRLVRNNCTLLYKIYFNIYLSFLDKMKGFCKTQHHQNQISGQMGHVRGVGYV